MVLIKVDLPRPVCPAHRKLVYIRDLGGVCRTNTDDVELETSLEELLLDLLGDAVETNMASREDSVSLIHCRSHIGTENTVAKQNE